MAAMPVSPTASSARWAGRRGTLPSTRETAATGIWGGVRQRQAHAYLESLMSEDVEILSIVER
jgi:hypothetical protein